MVLSKPRFVQIARDRAISVKHIQLAAVVGAGDSARLALTVEGIYDEDVMVNVPRTEDVCEAIGQQGLWTEFVRRRGLTDDEWQDEMDERIRKAINHG